MWEDEWVLGEEETERGRKKRRRKTVSERDPLCAV